MYNAFDYQVEIGNPTFRIPRRYGWFFYAYWVSFILLMFLGFYYQINNVGVSTRLSVLRGVKSTIKSQNEEYNRRLTSLRDSNRKKELWMPLASLRHNHTKLMAKIVEAIPSSVVLEHLMLAQDDSDNTKVTLNLNLVVLGLSAEAATQKIAEYRNAFRTFEGYTLSSNTDNNTGVTRAMRVRGLPSSEYRVQETWIFTISRVAEPELLKTYIKLNADFPIGGK